MYKLDFVYSYDNSIENDCVTRVINHTEEYIRYNLVNHPLRYRFSPFLKMNKRIWRTAIFFIYKPITDYDNAISTSTISNHIGSMFCYCCSINLFNKYMEKYCPEIERRQLPGLTTDVNTCKWYEYKLGFINEPNVPISYNCRKFSDFRTSGCGMIN